MQNYMVHGYSEQDFGYASASNYGLFFVVPRLTSTQHGWPKVQHMVKARLKARWKYKF